MGSNPINGGNGDGLTPGSVDQNLLDILLGGDEGGSPALSDFAQGQSPVCREPGTEGALGYSAESYSTYRPSVTPSTTSSQPTPVGAERYFTSGLSSSAPTASQWEGILGAGVQDLGYVPHDGKTYLLDVGTEFQLDGMNYEVSDIGRGAGVVVNIDEFQGYKFGDVIDTGRGSTFRIIKDGSGYKIEITRTVPDFQATIDALASEVTRPCPPPASAQERITLQDGQTIERPIGPEDVYSFKRIGNTYYAARMIEVESGVFEPGPYYPLETFGFGPDYDVGVETGFRGQPELVIENYPKLTPTEEGTAVFRRPESRGPVPAERGAYEPGRSGVSAADPSSNGMSSEPLRDAGGPACRLTEIPPDDFFRIQTPESSQSTPSTTSTSPAEQAQCSESEMGYSAEAYEGYRSEVTPSAPLSECRDLGAVPRDGAVHLVDATTEFSIDGKSYSVVRYPDGYFLQESGTYDALPTSLNRYGVGDVMYTGNGHLLELVNDGGVLKVAVTRRAPSSNAESADSMDWSDVNLQSEAEQSSRLSPEEQRLQDRARLARIDESISPLERRLDAVEEERYRAEARAAGAEDIEVIGRRGPVPAERQAIEPRSSGFFTEDPLSGESTSAQRRMSANSPANRSTEVCVNDFFGSQATGSSQRTTAAPTARVAAPTVAAETAYSAGVGGFYGVSLSFVNNGIEYVVGREAAPYVEAPVDYGVIGAMCMASGSTAASVAAGGPVVAPLAEPAQSIARSVTETVGIDPNSTAGRATESGIAGTILGMAAKYLAPAIQAAETAASDLFWPLFVVNVAATAVQHPEETRQVVETVAQAANDGFNTVVRGTLGEGAVETCQDIAESEWNPINMLVQDAGTVWDLLGDGGQLIIDGAEAVFDSGEVEDPFQNGFIW